MISIVFEIPSHKFNDVMYLIQVAGKTKNPKIGFAISTNGYELSPNYNYGESNIVIEYKQPKVVEPAVSMAEVRSNANDLATIYFRNPEYRIMADGNFKYKPGWEEFVLEAVEDMKRFKSIINRECYLGMGGVFGSYGHGKNPFLGPQPLVPTTRGIIYTMTNVWDKMQKLPSGLEEQYMCSILFMAGHIPLRKMCSPISHTRCDDEVGIHDKSIIDRYNSQIVRDIWKDPNWVLKPSYSGKDKLTDGRYYAHCPKNSLKAMANLKIELSKIKGVEEFLRIDYNGPEPQLKMKDLF